MKYTEEIFNILSKGGFNRRGILDKVFICHFTIVRVVNSQTFYPSSFSSMRLIFQ